MYKFRDLIYKFSLNWKFSALFVLLISLGGKMLKDSVYQNYYTAIVIVLFITFALIPPLFIGKEYDDLIKVYNPERKLMNSKSDSIQFILLIGLIIVGYFVFQSADILMIIIYLVITLLISLLILVNGSIQLDLSNKFQKILLTKSKLVVYIFGEKNEFELNNLEYTFPRLDEIYLEQTIQGKKKSILTDIRLLAKNDKSELKKYLEEMT